MARDNRIEDWLKSEGVAFLFLEKLSLGEIDQEASRRNQARFEPILADAVDRYARAMSDGAQFPPLVAYRGQSGYVLIDGNQRFAAAHRLRVASFDTYVVSTDDRQVLDRLTRTANLHNGQPPSREESLNQAIAWVERWNTSITDTARMFQVDASTLGARLRGLQCRRRLQRQGFNMDKLKLSERQVERLNAIPIDEVLKKAVELVSTAGLGTEATQELVGEIRQHHDQDGMLGVIAEYEARPEIRAAKAKSKLGAYKLDDQQRTELFRRMDSLVRHIKQYPTLERLRIVTTADRSKLEERWLELSVLMEELLNAENRTHASAPNGAVGREVALGVRTTR